MTEKEIVALLKTPDDQALFKQARDVREKYFGKDVYLRAIIEFSNVCSCDCLYCGLRTGNGDLFRYRLPLSEVLSIAETVPSFGIGSIVLQSGDDFSYAPEDIAELIRAIKRTTDVAVTLSLGERPDSAYELWKKAGADRYLLKIETFDPVLYEKMRPGKKLDDRIRRVKLLKDLGYETGSGIIVGLPGMTLESLAHDLFLLTDLGLDMISAGPFVPHPETPLASADYGNPEIVYKTTAVLRILNPKSNIPATSALTSLDPSGKKKALLAGANVIMPSLTPPDIRALYNIYPGKNTVSDEAAGLIEDVKKTIRSVGLTPSDSKGFSKR